MALMKITTQPKIRPNPSARLVPGIFAILTGELVTAGSPGDEVELNDKDVVEPDADVVVVGSITPKKDDAMEDIFGCAAACMPLHSPSRDRLSGF